ncbi:hypothetical protein M5K25_001111 [Dendrobium thyrsiflorum]|uniref:DUF4283 domain-containing protein n=1 Tax=Dendrobium thyrsiflorum TaxID=117978 RepID=A0ABD0WCK3_DENTH
MVWSKGAWFIFGKPFIFQRWSSHFSPKREEFTSVPIWVKIHDLPLCCWTPVGISKIATKIGQPLAVDALTASKSRLTYARVCVQVDSSASFPDFIPITVVGKLFNLQIQYEWRPTICHICKSFNHQANACPSNPTPLTVPPKTFRGRSKSRRARPPSQNPKGLLPTPAALPENHFNNHTTTDTSVLPNLTSAEPPPSPHLHAEATPPTDALPPSAPSSALIPNLNSPTLPASSSSDPLLPSSRSSPTNTASPSKTLSANKFSALQALSDTETTSTHYPMDVATDHATPTGSPPASKVLPAASQPKAVSQSHRNTRGKGSRKCPNSSTGHL